MLVEEVIPVAVIVDKKKAESRWIDHIWVPARVVTGLPEAEPMTRIARDGENESYYAGATSLVIASTETANYGTISSPGSRNSGSFCAWASSMPM